MDAMIQPMADQPRAETDPTDLPDLTAARGRRRRLRAVSAAAAAAALIVGGLSVAPLARAELDDEVQVSAEVDPWDGRMHLQLRRVYRTLGREEGHRAVIVPIEVVYADGTDGGFNCSRQEADDPREDAVLDRLFGRRLYTLRQQVYRLVEDVDRAFPMRVVLAASDPYGRVRPPEVPEVWEVQLDRPDAWATARRRPPPGERTP